jgi:hypothetical protein
MAAPNISGHVPVFNYVRALRALFFSLGWITFSAINRTHPMCGPFLLYEGGDFGLVGHLVIFNLSVMFCASLVFATTLKLPWGIALTLLAFVFWYWIGSFLDMSFGV